MNARRAAASPPVAPAAPGDILIGLLAGLGAQAMWGFSVLYFKAVAHVPPLSLVAHRTLWSVPLVIGLIAASRGLPRLRTLLSDRRTLLFMPISAALLGCNWLGFVYAIASGQVLQAALAYFITPLMMAALGVIVLKERLRPLQKLGVALACVGVIVLIAGAAIVPWLALAVGGSWSLYSLIRRARQIPAVEGFAVELLMLVVPATLFLSITGWLPQLANSPHTPGVDLILLIASGAVTTVPLIFFGLAARRLALTTLGFIQYLGPTIQFLLAVLYYGEPFDAMKGVAYGFIWMALIVYTIDSRTAARRAARHSAQQAAAEATESAAAAPTEAELALEGRAPEDRRDTESAEEQEARLNSR